MHTGSKRRLLIALLCALVPAAGLACAVPAFGARAHEFKEAFGELCSAEPCTGAQLKEANGVSVNEATGDVYVSDKGANRVVDFSEAGAPLGELTGPNAVGSGTLTEGSSTIESALATSGAFSIGEEITAPGLPSATIIIALPGAGVLEVSNPVEAGKSGVAVELKARQRFESPEGIAVDNSCVLQKLSGSACETADPSNGDLYVVDGGHRVVDKFSASGGYLGQIREAGGESLQSEPLDGVATDPQGGVWIYREGREILGFTNEQSNVFTPPVVVSKGGTKGRFFGLPGIAADSTGAFYVRYGESTITSRIAKVNPSGTVLSEELDNQPSTAVAVDQTNDDPAICNTTTLAIFDPEGALLERLGEESGQKRLTRCAGVAVNAKAGSLYASDPAAGSVVLFGPAKPNVPKVESESISGVGEDRASFAATINPRSEEGEAQSEYRFQYGRCISSSRCEESGYEASTPVGLLPADFNVHAVAAKVEGLTPSTTYHFRALAENSHGQGPGEERIFRTEGPGGELVLPDNRGWELVSPPDKQGALIEPIVETGVIQAAADGSAITYLANSPTELHPQGNAGETQVLSSRGSAAWSSRDIAIAHKNTTGGQVAQGPEYRFFSTNLGLGAVQQFGEFFALSEEASEQSAYLHDLGPSCGAHCFRPLVTGRAGFANVPEGTQFGEEEECTSKVGEGTQIFCGPQFLGATDDLSHVVLRSHVPLKVGAASGALYEWSAGALTPVSVPPGEDAAVEGKLGLKDRSARNAISTDGSRVVWSSSSALYLRDMSQGKTVQLDAATCEESEECQSGGGQFQLASPDGSRVLFTDTQKLTADSGANAGEREADLYECRIVTSPTLGCQLRDLTPKHEGEGANVQGSVLGASENGADVYFVAKGVLTEEENARKESATTGQANLYLSRDGQLSFIATLSGGDEHDWSIVEGTTAGPAAQPTRVSPNGRFLELMSEAPLSGYNNRDVKSGAPVAEVYTFDAGTGRIACASCLPSGARPSGIEYRKLEPGNGGLVGGPRDIWPLNALVGANVPGWVSLDNTGASRHQPRYLSDSGRLFFNSAAALVPQDSNGIQDVYEYDPLGLKGAEGRVQCEESSPTYSPTSAGCIALISAGRSTQESAFLDASESGDDVFFLTSAKLSQIDVDTSFDVYDAHVCTSSGPCITFPDVGSPPCSTEASCKAPPSPQPSIFGAPASATFQGPGNPAAETPKPKPKTPEELRKERLAKALKACRAKKSKTKRKACEAGARRRYAPPGAKKSAHRAKKAKAKGRRGK